MQENQKLVATINIFNPGSLKIPPNMICSIVLKSLSFSLFGTSCQKLTIFIKYENFRKVELNTTNLFQ